MMGSAREVGDDMGCSELSAEKTIALTETCNDWARPQFQGWRPHLGAQNPTPCALGPNRGRAHPGAAV